MTPHPDQAKIEVAFLRWLNPLPQDRRFLLFGELWEAFLQGWQMEEARQKVGL